MKNKSILLAFIVTLINIRQCYGDRTKDKMYQEINGAGCFRRMNGTHQFGCSSDRKGSSGVIYFVEDASDISNLIKLGSASFYVPVMTIDKLTRENVELLKTSDKINGIVIYKPNNTEIKEYSHEDKCPNRNYALEGTCDVEWNSPGTDLLNFDFGYPVFYILNNTDVDEMRNCFNTFNNFSLESHYERSLCSVELNFFMYAVLDTPTCLRRSAPRFNFNTHRVCDPIGAFNIWTSLFPIGNTTVNFGNTTQTETVKKDAEYIVVASRLDTTSLFFSRAPGAINPISNIVTLLYTSYLMKQLLPENKNYQKNLLFILFNGESYDYTGSQRFLYDMEQKQFPSLDSLSENETASNIFPANISLFIELSQLSNVDALHAHVHDEKPEIRNFLTKLYKYAKNTKITEQIGRIPPASLQTFLKSYPNMSGLVLTDHNASYANKFYNSMYDDVENLNYEYYNSTDEFPKDSIQQHIVNVSQILAASLYEEITGNQLSNMIDQNFTLVDELLYCYLKNINCDIHQAVQKKKYQEDPINLYVGVPNSANIVITLMGLTLVWLSGDIVNSTGSCPGDINSNLLRYYNMSKSLTDNTTICYRSSMNWTDSTSPAFLIDDYDWTSGKYSSWSESAWQQPNIRMFLRPSKVHENMTIAVGSLSMALSFILVYLIKSRSHILFPPPIETASPTRC